MPAEVSSPFDPLWLRVLEPLRRRIVQGEFQPGEALSENRLAAEYGVSRTPVREALRILIDDGLIEMLPGRKLRVTVPQPTDVREIYDVRWILESEALRRITADPGLAARLVAELEACCDLGEQAWKDRDMQALAQANERFHELLISALDNRRMLAQFRNVHDLITLYRTHTLKSEQWAQAGVAEHRELTRLLHEGDTEGALKLLAAHLDHAQQVLKACFENTRAA